MQATVTECGSTPQTPTSTDPPQHMRTDRIKTGRCTYFCKVTTEAGLLSGIVSSVLSVFSARLWCERAALSDSNENWILGHGFFFNISLKKSILALEKKSVGSPEKEPAGSSGAVTLNLSRLTVTTHLSGGSFIRPLVCQAVLAALCPWARSPGEGR